MPARVLTMCVLIGVLRGASGLVRCEDGWIMCEYSRKCFYVSSDQLSFYEAVEECRDKITGSELASPAIVVDIKALREHVSNPSTDFWVHLYKNTDYNSGSLSRRRQGFQWGDGSAFQEWAHEFWSEGEPGVGEKYGRLADGFTSFKGHTDNQKNGYICQAPLFVIATPVPMMTLPPITPSLPSATGVTETPTQSTTSSTASTNPYGRTTPAEPTSSLSTAGSSSILPRNISMSVEHTSSFPTVGSRTILTQNIATTINNQTPNVSSSIYSDETTSEPLYNHSGETDVGDPTLEPLYESSGQADDYSGDSNMEYQEPVVFDKDSQSEVTTQTVDRTQNDDITMYLIGGLVGGAVFIILVVLLVITTVVVRKRQARAKLFKDRQLPYIVHSYINDLRIHDWIFEDDPIYESLDDIKSKKIPGIKSTPRPNVVQSSRKAGFEHVKPASTAGFDYIRSMSYNDYDNIHSQTNSGLTGNNAKDMNTAQRRDLIAALNNELLTTLQKSDADSSVRILKVHNTEANQSTCTFTMNDLYNQSINHNIYTISEERYDDVNLNDIQPVMVEEPVEPVDLSRDGPTVFDNKGFVKRLSQLYAKPMKRTDIHT